MCCSCCSIVWHSVKKSNNNLRKSTQKRTRERKKNKFYIYEGAWCLFFLTINRICTSISRRTFMFTRTTDEKQKKEPCDVCSLNHINGISSSFEYMECVVHALHLRFKQSGRSVTTKVENRNTHRHYSNIHMLLPTSEKKENKSVAIWRKPCSHIFHAWIYSSFPFCVFFLCVCVSLKIMKINKRLFELQIAVRVMISPFLWLLLSCAQLRC